MSQGFFRGKASPNPRLITDPGADRNRDPNPIFPRVDPQRTDSRDNAASLSGHPEPRIPSINESDERPAPRASRFARLFKFGSRRKVAIDAPAPPAIPPAQLRALKAERVSAPLQRVNTHSGEVKISPLLRSSTHNRRSLAMSGIGGGGGAGASAISNGSGYLTNEGGSSTTATTVGNLSQTSYGARKSSAFLNNGPGDLRNASVDLRGRSATFDPLPVAPTTPQASQLSRLSVPKSSYLMPSVLEDSTIAQDSQAREQKKSYKEGGEGGPSVSASEGQGRGVGSGTIPNPGPQKKKLLISTPSAGDFMNNSSGTPTMYRLHQLAINRNLTPSSSGQLQPALSQGAPSAQSSLNGQVSNSGISNASRASRNLSVLSPGNPSGTMVSASRSSMQGNAYARTYSNRASLSLRTGTSFAPQAAGAARGDDSSVRAGQSNLSSPGRGPRGPHQGLPPLSGPGPSRLSGPTKMKSVKDFFKRLLPSKKVLHVGPSPKASESGHPPSSPPYPAPPSYPSDEEGWGP